MEIKITKKKFLAYLTVISISAILLYFINLQNYLLYHSLIEIFSVLVSFTIFIIAYNSRKQIKNNFFIFIGTGYLFIGALDLIHTLAYEGMGIFSGFNANLPTQLWISARYLEAIVFVAGLLLLTYKKRFSYNWGRASRVGCSKRSLWWWD